MPSRVRSVLVLVLSAATNNACSDAGGAGAAGAAGSVATAGAAGGAVSGAAGTAPGGSAGVGAASGAASSADAGASTGGMLSVGGSPTVPESSDDYPALLSATGLYSDIESGALAPGVRAYVPQFALWSDGSTKARWLYLPPGQHIDTSDMDNWVYPVGTKFWKEFASDRLPNGSKAAQALRIETRLLWKFGTTQFDWLSVAYIWNESQTDAAPAPDGMNDAGGTLHDVPSKQACDSCHTNKRQRQIGPGAVQLAHDGPGLTLKGLVAEGLLSVPPRLDVVVPGSDVERAALGYLHANCGHCHREGSSAGERYDLRTWLTVASLVSVDATDTYQHYVNRLSEVPESELEYRIKGGSPDESELVRRMLLRSSPAQMPPVGSELVDEGGVAVVRAWIETLPPP